MGVDAPVSNLVVRKTSQVEYLKDTSSTAVNVGTTSATFATLLSAALPDDVLGVTLVVGDEEIRYNPAGAASAANSLLPSVFTIWGTKAVLDLAQFYSASTIAMGVIVHVPALTPDA